MFYCTNNTISWKDYPFFLKFFCTFVKNLISLLVGMWTVQPQWRTVWRFLKKLEIQLPYDLAIPLLGIYTEETRSERDTCTPMFIAALFIIARTWKQPRCPSANEWIRKLWYIYTTEYYSAIKKECIWISLNEVDETGAHYTEWSKSKRKAPIQYINAYMWNLERW